MVVVTAFLKYIDLLEKLLRSLLYASGRYLDIEGLDKEGLVVQQILL